MPDNNVEPITRVAVWQGSARKKLIARLARPAFGLLNRPVFRRAAELAYDIALRWNGFAIGFPGRRGVSHPEERFLERFLPTLTDGVMIDVGANAGTYAAFLHAVRPDLPLIAFEPHPKTFRLLADRIDGLPITAVNAALSDASGRMELHDFAENDGSTQASLGASAVALFEGERVTHQVDVLTLDDYAERNGIARIAWLKIDTEGFDINVLRGARSLLSSGRIGAIQFEIIPACIAMRVTVRDFFDVLAGFKLYRLCVNGGLWPLERYDVKRCEIYVVHNIIAIHGAGAPP